MDDTQALPPPLLNNWIWQERAACRGADSTVFFPTTEESHATREAQTRQAKAVCRRCPVVAICLDHALRAREPYGVWGGRTEAERAEMLGLESLRYPARRSRPPRRSAASRREAWQALMVARRADGGEPVRA